MDVPGLPPGNPQYEERCTCKSATLESGDTMLGRIYQAESVAV